MNSAMNTDELTNLVTDTLEDVAPGCDAAGIDLDADFPGELDLDSMDMLAFVEALSTSTGVDVPERDVPEIRTIRGCVAYIAAHVPA